jgi:hypothetical protein
MQQIQLRITTASRVLAMLHSRNAVKEALRNRGLKLTEYSAREITSWARVYLQDHHAELMPDAIKTATQWALAGEFGKRMQAQARQLCANLSSDAQRTEA